ncbi:MAG TPA: EAL domain-containing protein [Candidatus Limnocylindrales bacterium]|nr:EAL domain-containing protein [Candidatus Limnocylindrales bacterium]
MLELESGMVVIGPASEMTDALAAAIAKDVHSPAYGLVDLDPRLDEPERHLAGMAEAVQLSGLADRIGMSPSTTVAQMKTLDYFFSLRNVHQVAFQPIVELSTGRLHEYECLFRPSMPMLPQSISAIVHAAIDTDRSIELDAFIVRLILSRAGDIEAARRASGDASLRIAINFTPASLLDPQFEARALADMVADAGLSPRQITLECTEEQAVPDVDQLKRQVKALRRLGFGFAVDDAGAGYASFALIAALRPSVIKIDRLIATGVARDDAKQALVEAFVSFGRRIGARLLAEGIERRADLAMLSDLGVEFGQGYLIGRPSYEPQAPRPMAGLRLDARATVARRVRDSVPKRSHAHGTAAAK